MNCRTLPLIILISTLLVACASSATRENTNLTTSSVAKPSAQRSPTRAGNVANSPDWKNERKAWCRMRERQKVARKSASEPIAGTADPYLISVHDEMCRAP